MRPTGPLKAEHQTILQMMTDIARKLKQFRQAACPGSDGPIVPSIRRRQARTMPRVPDRRLPDPPTPAGDASCPAA